MEIKYLGHSSFRIKGKTGAVVCDPFNPEAVGLKFPKDVVANAVTVSHDHSDHNDLSQVLGNPVRIAGPGEYEVSQIKIFGYPSFHDNDNGLKRGKNTIYVIKTDGVAVCHLGDLGHKLADQLIEELGNIDILLIPVGGFYTIDAKEAVEVIHQIEPRIVIPMHYQKGGLKETENLLPLAVFVKEMGKTPETLNKLNISVDKLPSETTVVVLEQ